jgi:y4mF family transcriptional regulator
MDMKMIGSKIRQKRKLLKMTQRQVAGMCNVGVRFLSELENGKESAEIGLVMNVLNNLGMDLDIKERRL